MKTTPEESAANEALVAAHVAQLNAGAENRRRRRSELWAAFSPAERALHRFGNRSGVRNLATGDSRALGVDDLLAIERLKAQETTAATEVPDWFEAD